MMVTSRARRTCGNIERSGRLERDGDFLLPYQRQFLAAVTRRDNRPELAACRQRRTRQREDIFVRRNAGEGFEAVR